MSETVKVGEIQGCDVLYIPEKDIIFCKNTAIKVSLIVGALKSNMSVEEIPEKNLTIIKDNGTVTLGCLTTTMTNCKEIIREITKIKSKK